MSKRTEFIVEYSGDRVTVLRWLVEEMTDDVWKLYKTNLSAKNDDGKYRWCISAKKNNNRVRFSNQEDAQIFALVWGEKWDFT